MKSSIQTRISIHKQHKLNRICTNQV